MDSEQDSRPPEQLPRWVTAMGPDLVKVHSHFCPCGGTDKATTQRGRLRRIPCPHAMLIGRRRWEALGRPPDRESCIEAMIREQTDGPDKRGASGACLSAAHPRPALSGPPQSTKETPT